MVRQSCRLSESQTQVVTPFLLQVLEEAKLKLLEIKSEMSKSLNEQASSLRTFEAESVLNSKFVL